MANLPIAGKTTTIKIEDTSVTPAVDIVDGCCLKDIGDLSITSDTIDVSCHGTNNFRRKVKGMVDLGTMDVTIMYKDAATASRLYQAVTDNKSYAVTITIPNPNVTTGDETLKFSAYVGSMSQTHSTDDAMTCVIQLGLDGGTKPTWA